MADIKIEDLNEIFNSKDGIGANIIDDNGLGVNLYHLYDGHSLHVKVKKDEPLEPSNHNLYYLVISGTCEFIFPNEKKIVNTHEMISFPSDFSFDVYSIGESTILFISGIEANVNNEKNKLCEGIKQLEEQEPYTKGHNNRVGKYSNIIMHYMNPNYCSDDLLFAGVYHDIGKVLIDSNILNKAGKLSEEEWNIMKEHPTSSYKMLENILGENVANIAYSHHEKLDGSGYPRGLKGEEISLEARVLAVADIYDALTSERTYRKKMENKEALEVLYKEACEGKIDLECVQALEKIIELNMLN